QLRDSPGTPDEVLELARRAIAGGGLDLAGSASGWSAGRRRERLTEACGAVQDAAASGRLTAAEVAAVAAVWQRDGAIGEGDEWNALRQRIAELGRSR
ncbi:MAG: hypothetical protein KDE27_16140, partial [Planctomycetes bacterium]|nr:hypothetical protein [Planctomycetota bacterium]